jgi:hypothetical protein
VSSGCAGHCGGGGDVPRRRRGMEAELARRSSTAARHVGAGGDSGGVPIALRKVEEGERQLNPKENHVKAARRWLSPWRGQLSDNGDSTKFPTHGAASSDRVQTLVSTERGEGRQRGPWWRLHGQQGRRKKGGDQRRVAKQRAPDTGKGATEAGVDRAVRPRWNRGVSVGRSGERRKENGPGPME